MRAVIQKVSRAHVDVLAGQSRERSGQIEAGLMVLLGVCHADTEADARYIADKIAGLRIFEDEAGKLNRSVQDIGGAVLLVNGMPLVVVEAKTPVRETTPAPVKIDVGQIPGADPAPVVKAAPLPKVAWELGPMPPPPQAPPPTPAKRPAPAARAMEDAEKEQVSCHTRCSPWSSSQSESPFNVNITGRC